MDVTAALSRIVKLFRDKAHPGETAGAFVAYVLPFFLVVLAAGWYAGDLAQRNAVDSLGAGDAEDVAVAAASVPALLSVPSGHLRSLAGEDDVVAAYAAATTPSEEPMERAFRSLMSRNNYRSVTWLDADGRERVKVYREDGLIRPARDGQLLDQRHARYIAGAFAAVRGEIFVAPFEVVVEQMKQLGTPEASTRLLLQVFDRKGESRGLLCIELDAEDLLQGYARTNAAMRERVWLVDRDGRWVFGPDGARAWNTVPGGTFLDWYPAALQQLTAATRGQTRLAEGLWTWRAVELETPVETGTVAPTLHWLAVALIPESELAEAGFSAFKPVLIVGSLLLLLYTVMVTVLVRQRGRRLRAQSIVLRAAEEARDARSALQAQLKFKAVFDSTASGLLLVDDRLIIISANRELERMFRYAPGELDGRPLGTLVPMEIRSQHALDAAGYVRRPRARRMGDDRELEGLCKDGSPIAVEVALNSFVEDGRTYSVANVVDVSTRRRAERTDRHRRRVTQMIVEGQPLDVVMVAIARGLEELLPGALCRLLLVDDDGARLGGGAAPSLPAFYVEAIDGIAIAEGVGSCGTAAALARRVIVEDIQRHPYWKDFRDLAGRAGLRSCWSEPVLDRKNRVLGTFAVYHRTVSLPRESDLVLIEHAAALASIAIERHKSDVELQKHREHLEQLVEQRSRTISELNEQLEKRALDAEEANISKSTFLANMSHEIRTPMNAVIGFSRLIRERTTDPEQVGWLDKTIAAGGHLLKIIDDILDFSKIDAGQLRLELQPFVLGAMISHACSMISPLARAKGIGLTEDIPAELAGVVLRGDAFRLRQVLLNLMGNAVKFTERGGVTVRVRLEPGESRLVTLRVEVHDTGIGITDEQRPALFRPFEQGETSTTRRFGGTGLGLAICARLIELMGGATGVDSVPGEGSTFWFTAVLALADPGEQVPAEERRPSSGKRLRDRARVLVVEDNEINQDVIKAILQDFGIEVSVAADGASALEILERGDLFDLVLMDMQMPVMDGLEATRRIHRLPGLDSLPIVALTANAFAESRELCRAAGMVDFVSKPVDVSRLWVVLERFLAPVETATICPEPAAPVSVSSERLDFESGLRRVGGQLPLYHRLLEKFVASHGDDSAAIRATRDSGDIDSARRIAHTLKGTSATLGMDSVREIAARLESLLREGAGVDVVNPTLIALDLELKAVLRMIQTFLAGRRV